MRWVPTWIEAKIGALSTWRSPLASWRSPIARWRSPAAPDESCRAKARALVHKYAAFGTAWAILPIPIGTSIGLTALETHLVYWIGRIYGEEPGGRDVAMTAAGLELASVALKTVAIEGATFAPGIGWGIKATIAGTAIEGIGTLVIDHYEKKYPGKRS